MTAFLAANWLRIIAALILLVLLVWVFAEDYRFQHEHRDPTDPRPQDWWGA